MLKRKHRIVVEVTMDTNCRAKDAAYALLWALGSIPQKRRLELGITKLGTPKAFDNVIAPILREAVVKRMNEELNEKQGRAFP